jgi:hypothetical protein
VFQIHTTIQGIDGVLASDKCADYASNSSSLAVPCDAAECVAVVKDVVSKLPNCTLSDGGASVNKRTELQNGVDECAADASASFSVEAATSPTSASPTSVSSAGGECTSAEASATATLYLGAASLSACEPYTIMDAATMTVYIYAPCSATQCVAVMAAMLEQLPDCYSDGVNLKDDIAQSLASCSSGESSAVDGFSSRSSSLECTYDEVSSLADLTDAIVTSTECESYVTVTTAAWYIAVPCSATACLSTLDAAVDQMPDCEFEGENYKQELGQQQQACVDVVGSSETGTSGSSVNRLRTPAPASDSSKTSTDTSSAPHFASSSALTLLHVASMLLALL